MGEEQRGLASGTCGLRRDAGALREPYGSREFRAQGGVAPTHPTRTSGRPHAAATDQRSRAESPPRVHGRETRGRHPANRRRPQPLVAEISLPRVPTLIRRSQGGARLIIVSPVLELDNLIALARDARAP